MCRLTVSRMESLVRGLSFGTAGLVFLPPLPRDADMEAGVAQLRHPQMPNWLPVDPLFLTQKVGTDVALMGGIVEKAHDAYNEPGRGQHWIRRLPIALQKVILRDRYLFRGMLDGESHPGFELAGFDTFIVDEFCVRTRHLQTHPGASLLHLVEKAFQSSRLARVHQWGYLEYTTLDVNDGWLVLTNRSPHSRQTHMRDAYALMCLLTRNARLPRWIQLVLRVAALTHDVFTIAGGDSMKWCDPNRLHEERLYAELLGTTGWPELSVQLGLPEPQATELLVATVQGRGPYRDALKLVDWMAYLGRDVDAYRRIPRLLNDGEPIHRQIHDLLDRHPRLCGLWDDIHIEDGRVYFTDVQRYEALAQVRMMLYHHLYLDPRMRYREYLMASVIGKALYDAGMLTKDNLLQWGDHELDRFFCAALDVSGFLELHRRLGQPRIETYKTLEEGLRREAELLGRGVRVVFLENLVDYRIKPGISFQVQGKDGRITPFHEVRRETADTLSKSSTLAWPVRVYYAEHPDLPPRLEAMLDAYHARRRGVLTLTSTK